MVTFEQPYYIQNVFALNFHDAYTLIVESQDDEIAKDVHNLKLKNIEIQIPELYRRGFKEKISSKDAALVLFYLACKYYDNQFFLHLFNSMIE